MSTLTRETEVKVGKSAAALPPAVKKFLAKPGKLLIDNRWVEAADGKTFPVYDPATGEVIAQVAEGGEPDIRRAVQAARKAFDAGPWPAMTPSERGKSLWKIADLLEQNLEEFADLESLDNGKPLTVARVADVPLAVDLLRYMAGWATKIEGNTIPLSVPTPGAVLRLHAPRADRRGGADHSLELPPADGRVEARPGAGRRLHGRAEAGRADPADRPAAGRIDRRKPACPKAW